ncbi:hypothetical protein [uncultured Serinicoccus sp.]|uniref:hypothetical protein n=1 Tax=uncultured Serinicoccus sp. TaxID=735514 RepID=UPI002634AE25|nr:hypothetical protein [uncultured Serinicoccus sp.]
MQRERRENPYPFDWQLAAGVAVAALVVVPTLGLHLGRLLANLTAGAGMTVAAQDQIFTSLPGLIRGDAAAGLDPAPGREVATTSALWAWSAAATLALTVLAIAATTWWWQRQGPGKVLGMATRAEAEQLLGHSRLRKHRHVICPDLYPRRRLADALVGIVTRSHHDAVDDASRETQTW